MKQRMILATSGLFGALGIAIGAFGAHALPNILTDLSPEEFAQRRAWLEAGVQYHMYHAVALLAVGLSGDERSRYSGSAIAWSIGIVVFSGCLYAMTMTGVKILGAVVPIGGVAYIVGWILVLVAALRPK